MRIHRSRTTVLAAPGTAALALVLTACGPDGTDTKAAGTAQTPATAQTAPGATDATPTTASGQGASSAPGAGAGKSTDAAPGAGTGKDSPTPRPAGATQTPADPASASAPLCTVKDIAISAALQDRPPYTHLVLTAKNTSGHSCRLNEYPQIRFLESHRENVPAVAKSKPAAPVVLTAGAPAYAVVRLSNGGVHENNEPVTAFSVTLAGGSGPATVKAPGNGGIAVNPAAWATGYWTPELRNGADEF
ncbi:DUF4232 domain-containing protein [Kitasatospora sp. NPDC050463]|uniref:DUF4232 domain-containing protein n=1 Tax=Kitasatospora sp. NPDC050463 TaxID=3155786 RepID=UPI0033CD41DE